MKVKAASSSISSSPRHLEEQQRPESWSRWEDGTPSSELPACSGAGSMAVHCSLFSCPQRKHGLYFKRCLDFLHRSLIPLGFSAFPIFQDSGLKTSTSWKGDTHTYTHFQENGQVADGGKREEQEGQGGNSPFPFPNRSPTHRTELGWYPQAKVSP